MSFLNMPVAIIETVTPHAGQEWAVAEALLKAVIFVRMEPGCQRYELLLNDGNTPCLTMMERWSSEEDWREHEYSAASQSLNADIAGKAELKVQRLARLL